MTERTFIHRSMPIAICLVGLSGLASAQTVTALQTLGGTGSIANDINESGLIVGYSYNDVDFDTTGNVWDSMGNVSSLAAVDGYISTLGYGLNDLGQIVGYSENAMGDRTATLWDNGRITNIGAELGAPFYSVARDINNNGAVVGAANTGGLFGKGFIWDQSGGQIAGTLFQGGSNLSINEQGVMAGHSFFFGDPDTATLAMPDGRGGYGVVEVGQPGFVFSIATAINNNGMTVGHTDFGLDEGWQAAIFTTDLNGPPGFPTLLGTLEGLNTSEANDVNDSGMIVGYSWDGEANGLDSRAWAWTNGVMYDLNSLLDETSEFRLLIEATGVNNNGDIVGYGQLHDGSITAFVINGFVPSPGSMSFLALSGLIASRRRRS